MELSRLAFVFNVEYIDNKEKLIKNIRRKISEEDEEFACRFAREYNFLYLLKTISEIMVLIFLAYILKIPHTTFLTRWLLFSGIFFLTFKYPPAIFIRFFGFKRGLKLLKAISVFLIFIGLYVSYTFVG